MTSNRTPLLKAVMQNWDEIGPEDWMEVEWHIFSDGYYEIVTTFEPDLETMMKSILTNTSWKERLVKKKTTGQMEAEAFLKLSKALAEEPWRDPSLIVHANDGVAWEIESYHEDGSIDKTSGRCDYIYGHRVLENIVSLLPSDGTRYDSSAFISISRKETEF